MYIETQRRSAVPTEEIRLAASLAHEINNPLDSVLNLLYLVESESTLTEQGHLYLSRPKKKYNGSPKSHTLRCTISGNSQP